MELDSLLAVTVEEKVGLDPLCISIVGLRVKSLEARRLVYAIKNSGPS